MRISVVPLEASMPGRVVFAAFFALSTTAVEAEGSSPERLVYEGPNRWMAEAIDQANALHDALDAGEDVPLDRFCDTLDAISLASAMGLEERTTYTSTRYTVTRYSEIVLPTEDHMAMLMASGYTLGPAMRLFDIDSLAGVHEACDAR